MARPCAREELTEKVFDAMLANRSTVKKVDAAAGWQFRTAELELQYTQAAAAPKGGHGA